MLRKPVKATEIEIEGHRYAVEFFEYETVHGARRFSCEVALDDADRIILDDASMTGLESKVSCLVPATLYSRLLASRASVAA